MTSRRGVRLVLVLAAALASLGFAAGASAASVTGTIKLDPATTQVDNGGTFNIKVISNTTVPISGVSASITFNKSVVQVTSIGRASAWGSAPLFLAADATAISTANQKGVLKGVASSFFPPTSVPAGAQDFVTVTFKAIACGTVALGLPIGKTNSDTQLLDGRSATYGNAIKITTTGATVTVCNGGGASGSPGASGSGALPSDSGGALPSDSIDPNASPSAAPSAAAEPSPGVAAPVVAASAAPADNGAAGTTSEQTGWLTFAMAALAIAAAGLATLILVLTIAAIVAAVTGAIVVIRVWNRHNENDAATEGGTPPVTTTGSSGPAEGAPAGDASADASTAPGAPADATASTPAPVESAPPAPATQQP